MKRVHLFEFEDLSWFPSLIREFMTDYLHFTASLTSTPFKGFAKKVKEAMAEQRDNKIIDLCSGGAGPIPQIVKELRNNLNYSVTATLTDLYPNLVAFKKAQSTYEGIVYIETPVDATRVPSELTGFRTVLNAFHHLKPELARKVLVDAVNANQGIAILELVGRSAFGFFSVLSLLIFMPLLTPFIRPFKVSRLVFTYLIPIVPLFSIWDGFVSCLRVYSVAELKELVNSFDSQGYRWDIGRMNVEGTPGHVTYLVGVPIQKNG